MLDLVAVRQENRGHDFNLKSIDEDGVHKHEPAESFPVIHNVRNRLLSAFIPIIWRCVLTCWLLGPWETGKVEDAWF